MTFDFEKIAVMDLDLYVSVWAEAILPLTQIGMPCISVCIFYDVDLISFTHGFSGFAHIGCILNLHSINAT